MYVVFFFKIVHNKRVDTIIRAVAREYQNFIRAVARGTRPPSLGKDVFFILNFEYIKLDRDKSTFKSHRDFSSEKEITFKHL